MINEKKLRTSFVGAAAMLASLLIYQPAWAHCDGLDGPVVSDAKPALEAGDVTPVLKWIPEKDEQKVKTAFKQAVTVRQQGGEAQMLADRYFFATLVRLHRTYEGASFTGLKPAGRDLGPALPAAEQALESGDLEPVTELLFETIRKNLQERHKEAMAAKSFDEQDVEAGRDYVEAYVKYVHYVEGLYEAASNDMSGHLPANSEAEHGH